MPEVPISAILFDKDGTLFDFRSSWGAFAADLLARLARDAAHRADLGRAMGYDPVTGQFACDSIMIAATTDEIAAAMLPHLPGIDADDLVDLLNTLSVSALMHPAVPLRPVLDGLRARGLRLGVATNDTEAPARSHLDAAGIRDLFDFVAGCDSGHGAKPEPGMLLAFARSQGLQPARVAMVGDSRHDLIAARRAGMWAVAVLTGVAGRAELAPHADVVLADIGALEAWLDGLATA